MRFQTLNDWLTWQETLNPKSIDLGLDRVREVLARLDLTTPPYPVITIAGTNGKGSVVAYLESILNAAGYLTGAYFSPHLLRYNERVRIAGTEIDDDSLCQAFARIDQARGDIALTYFEFGTLAALDIFRQQKVDVAVLEVGLGGRLDAVNAVDSLVAAVTSIGLDHTDWLGTDREAIGFEKAGVFRTHRPALCGDAEPPTSLLNHANAIDADLRLAGRDYAWQTTTNNWQWQGKSQTLTDLQPLPLAGEFQYANAALSLALLETIADTLPITPAAITTGLAKTRLPGRLQILPGAPTVILDVAHNATAATSLAAYLAATPCKGKTLGVLGMYADKDAESVVAALSAQIDSWYIGGLSGSRGQSGEALAARIKTAGADNIVCKKTTADAFQAASKAAGDDDRIIVFGSFQTVGSVSFINS
ncbi:MAG TPA: bifunctional tetrahydrofolate synthase/dihydrofolate synthase [Gammaproteobacteria bacterium]|nr:bifunctional tetrahydrofolate synthase/dihydrofolate synthase [Gammaproteobacteria bacterium]